MKHFSTFYISEVEFSKDSLVALFHYSFDKEVFFEETLDFSSPGFSIRTELDLEVLKNHLFHLSIALAISYYKLYPTKKIIIENGFLDDEDISFWKNFYVSGLGEFLFKNNISPINMVDFEVLGNSKGERFNELGIEENFLVPVGGGKDSIVSSLFFDRTGRDYTNFVFGKMDDVKQRCIEKNGKNTLLVKRKMSQKLFEMNEEGYYNGHVPISGIISFVLFVVAYIYNFKYIVFSNERSANEGNVDFHGLDVNHQYSKSYNFEQSLGLYLEKNISSATQYFSLLRCMFELKIAEIFAKEGKKYFSDFSSCNTNFKILKNAPTINTRWCGKCPKCLFVFTILYPFVSSEELLEIFGKNLFEDIGLLSLYRELIGDIGNKPFECVGEKEEVFLSSFLGLEKNLENTPALLQYFKENLLGKKTEMDINTLKEKYFNVYTTGHRIPSWLLIEIESIWGRKKIL